jgi:hypothetical protein
LLPDRILVIGRGKFAASTAYPQEVQSTLYAKALVETIDDVIAID